MLQYHGRHLQIKSITVTGSGQTSSFPDTAVIQAGIQEINKDIAAVQAAVNSRTNQLFMALARAGIDKGQVHSTEYRIEPLYSFDGNVQTIQNYRGTHLVSITLKPPGVAGETAELALANGANEISNIQFFSSEQGTLYHQSLAAAMKNAESKARVLAESIGVELLYPPITIVEESQLVPFSFEAAGSLATVIAPGPVTVTASIRVEFAFRNIKMPGI